MSNEELIIDKLFVAYHHIVEAISLCAPSRSKPPQPQLTLSINGIDVFPPRAPARGFSEQKKIQLKSQLSKIRQNRYF